MRRVYIFFFKVMVLLVMLFGSETWFVTMSETYRVKQGPGRRLRAVKGVKTDTGKGGRGRHTAQGVDTRR